MGKIFVRERVIISEGDAEPRFAVIGVEGEDIKLKFYKTHLRKAELEAVAKSVGAELVWLPHGEGENRGQEVAGGKRRRPRKHRGIGGNVEAA